MVTAQVMISLPQSAHKVARHDIPQDSTHYTVQTHTNCAISPVYFLHFLRLDKFINICTLRLKIVEESV